MLARLRSLSPSDDEAVPDSGEGEAETDALPEIRPPLVGPDDRKDAEVNLAWTLFQEGQLSQEDYSQALQDLTAMESKSVNVPITVLHVLWDRSYSHFSGLVTHLSRKYGIPFLSLSGFELQEELYLLLPLDFVQHNARHLFQTDWCGIVVCGAKSTGRPAEGDVAGDDRTALSHLFGDPGGI